MCLASQPSSLYTSPLCTWEIGTATQSKTNKSFSLDSGCFLLCRCWQSGLQISKSFIPGGWEKSRFIIAKPVTLPTPKVNSESPLHAQGKERGKKNFKQSQRGKSNGQKSLMSSQGKQRAGVWAGECGSVLPAVPDSASHWERELGKGEKNKKPPKPKSNLNK